MYDIVCETLSHAKLSLNWQLYTVRRLLSDILAVAKNY